MLGISGATLGAILRSKKHSYGKISIIALVYALVVFVISIVALLLGAEASTFMTWIPEGIVLFFGAVLIGVTSFVALLIGAVVFDISEAIIKSSR